MFLFLVWFVFYQVRILILKDENEQKGIRKMRLYASIMTMSNKILYFGEEETK